MSLAQSWNTLSFAPVRFFSGVFSTQQDHALVKAWSERGDAASLRNEHSFMTASSACALTFATLIAIGGSALVMRDGAQQLDLATAGCSLTLAGIAGGFYRRRQVLNPAVNVENTFDKCLENQKKNHGDFDRSSFHFFNACSRVEQKGVSLPQHIRQYRLKMDN